MSYTPGPWFIRREDKSGAIVLIHSEQYELAVLTSDNEAKEANALLIAAAPDLAQACVMLLESIMFPNKYKLEEIIKAAQEAVTKAQVLK